MWAAGELASCRRYSQRQNGGNESFVNVYHQCGGVQLCLFDMKGKCGCKMLCLLATSPRPDIWASTLADTFTCLSSPSSLPSPASPPSPHLFLPCAYFCHLIWSHWQKRGGSTPPTAPPSSLLHPPPISPRRYSRCGLPAPATPPLSSRG